MAGYVGPTESYLTPNAEDIRRCFDFWYLRSLVGVVEVGWKNTEDGSLNLFRRFDLTEIEEMTQFVVETNSIPGNAMYFRPALIKEGAKKFVRDEDFAQSPGCWVDLDDEGVAERAPGIYTFCRPNMVIITGLKPYQRVQMFWRLEDMESDPARVKRWNTGAATLLGGDTAVVNPTTLMRIPGTIAWPWKDGREVEQTHLVFPKDDRPKFYIAEALDRAFTQPEAKQEEQPRQTDETTDMFGRLNIEALLRLIRSGRKWHVNVLKLVDSLIARGTPDALILALAAHITIPPYTVDQTTRDLAGMIRTGRQKFNIPNQDDEFPDAPETEQAEECVPFLASDFVGIPAPRNWIVEGWLPHNEVSAIYGEGAVGKTLLMQQLATCVATGRHWLGLAVKSMPVFAVLCEDKKDELHRRQHAINGSLGIILTSELSEFRMWCRVGQENTLCHFDKNGRAFLTPFYADLIKRIAELPPGDKLVILDTLADIYGGNEIDRMQVNHFVKSTIGALCTRYGATVMMAGHPSQSGVATGAGYSGSTAWSNAVRNRLYLTRDEHDNDVRKLENLKANYSAKGAYLDLRWIDGAFMIEQQAPVSVSQAIAILKTIERAWDEKSSYSDKANAKDRYVVNMMMSAFDMNRTVATLLLSDWLANGVLVVEEASAKRHMFGLRVKFFPGEI